MSTASSGGSIRFRLRDRRGDPVVATKTSRKHSLADAVLIPLDWVEERSGLVGYTKWFLFRKVPHDISWAQTLGAAALTAFLSQTITGVVLLVAGMLEGFTGYLLPWDQTAYWATVVGINLNATAPFLGPFLAQFLQGGLYIGPDTLAKFYALHMLVLPGAI